MEDTLLKLIPKHRAALFAKDVAADQDLLAADLNASDPAGVFEVHVSCTPPARLYVRRTQAGMVVEEALNEGISLVRGPRPEQGAAHLFRVHATADEAINFRFQSATRVLKFQVMEHESR